MRYWLRAVENKHDTGFTKGGFKSEETGEFFRCQNKYFKSLSLAENLSFQPKKVNNSLKFSVQDSDLEYYLGNYNHMSLNNQWKMV